MRGGDPRLGVVLKERVARPPTSRVVSSLRALREGG
jgi:hypothetical protein